MDIKKYKFYVTFLRILLITLAISFIFIAFYIHQLLTNPSNILVRSLAIKLADSQGSTENYLSCSELPLKTTVEDVVKTHSDKVKEIENLGSLIEGEVVDNGISKKTMILSIQLIVDEKQSCPEKADILFSISKKGERVKVLNSINNTTFYDIPYRISEY